MGIISGIFVLVLSFKLQAQEEDYLHIAQDLGQGMELQEVSDRAYDNAEEYWEHSHGHERDGHGHEEHTPGTPDYDSHDGSEFLSFETGRGEVGRRYQLATPKPRAARTVKLHQNELGVRRAATRGTAVADAG